MLSREYNKKDYKSLVEWYKGWNIPVAPECFIPSLALVVEKETKPMCMGFVYQMGNTPMFWIEGIISDPAIEKHIRKEAIDLLVIELTQLAKNNGSIMVLSSSPREGLVSTFKKQGFKESPEKYHHLVKYNY